MTKAFDRLEWSFLEKAMRVMGFSSMWISRIMSCVTTASYSVLINGSVHGNITPSRGLRQGDPLSPFLFIMCSDMLANGLRQAERNKLLSGIRLGTSGPAISHLLFADDSIFFIKATKEEAASLKSILATYEKLSGQKVNLNKSSLMFGSSVPHPQKTLVSNLLEITSAGGKGIYLGLPEAFIGSKKDTLNYLEKRLTSKISSWKNRFLSQGGKETLIKAVALSLRTYTMSCFKLPKGVYNRITSILANFWWKNQETAKGVHWTTWDKLTKHKKDGGLGFRNVEGFNQALLGKQLWRLANNQTSLLARVLKSRYYPKDSILTAKIGSRPSYAWRSIQGTQSLMRKGLKKDFGSGVHIKPFEDPWIVDTSPRPPKPKQGIDISCITVGSFKSFNSDQWNLDNLKHIFEDSEIQLIRKEFTTPSSDHNESFSWILNKNGQYSVKSGYWLWSTSQHAAEQVNEVLNPNFLPLFEAIWKINCPPKIHHFLWRCLSGSLAVGEKMASRKLTRDSDCVICGSRSETINHMLFECGFSRLVWASSQAGSIFYPYPSFSLHSNLAACLMIHGEDKHFRDRIKSWPWIAWRIWKARNDICFSAQTRPPDALSIVNLAEEGARGWFIVNQKSQPHVLRHPQVPIIHNPGLKTWSKPDANTFKCNLDGSWKENSDICGTGWVLRDEEGRVKWYGMKAYPSLTAPLEVEAATLVWAMNVIDNLGFANVVFEMDCRELFQATSNPDEWHRLRVYLDEIFKPRRTLRPTFKLCPRSANGAADLLAKSARNLFVYFAELDCCCPSWLYPTLSNSVNPSN